METLFTGLHTVAPSPLADTPLFDFSGLMQSRPAGAHVMTFIAKEGGYAVSRSGTGAANAGLDVLAL
ncbi:MAG: hypothetical protein QX203_08795 [Methylococcaceae bacterium]